MLHLVVFVAAMMRRLSEFNICGLLPRDESTVRLGYTKQMAVVRSEIQEGGFSFEG